MPYLPPPSSVPRGSIVDCYIRDSGGDRQDQSTRQQLTEIQTYCAGHSLQLRHHFIDEAKSGGSTAGRDNFNRMIDAYRHPDQRPRALLLWNYARFARDLDDAIYYKALLRNRSITVHSLTDPIPEGQYGRIIEFFIDISNEEKRRQTSTDAQRGLRDLFLKHGCIPGTPPRGFKRQPVHIGTRRDGASHTAHRWVPDPDLIPLLKLAFQLKAQGATLAEIHKQTRLYTGISAYKAFFTNRLYIGIMHFGGETIENYCDPVIDMQTWNAVQKRIESHAQAKYDRHHPRRAHTPYILSGLVFCGECGSPMSANTTTRPPLKSSSPHLGGPGRDEAYRCSRSKRRAGCTQGRIGRRKLEDAVLDTLNNYILIPDVLEQLFAVEARSMDRIETRKETQLKALDAQRKKLASQIANLARAIAEKGHSEALLLKLTELENQRSQVSVEIREIENLHTVKSAPLTKQQIVALSKTMRENLTLSLPEQVRSIMLSFIHQIKVRKNGHGQIEGTITYYLPSFPLPVDNENGESPPFDPPPPETPGAGYNLPIVQPPVGAPPYRQTFTHPIIYPQKRPCS